MELLNFLFSFSDLVADAPREEIPESGRYVFMSDFHMGNGGSRDDLSPNREILLTALSRHYLARGSVLVLNGDIEDLSKFRYPAIRAAWAELYELFDAFEAQGRLRKIVGNHDLGLLGRKDYPYPLLPGLLLEYRGKRLFAFHGHQASKLHLEHEAVSDFLVRYLAKPLAIRNSSRRHESRRRYKAERLIYQASRSYGILSLTGHTHRPLFESLSKYDSLRYALEGLVREYPSAAGPRRAEIAELVGLYGAELERLRQDRSASASSRGLYDEGALLVPCLFNSGSATGKHGVTALELEAGRLSLVHWSGTAASRPYLAREELESAAIEGTPFRRHLLRSAELEHIFARIELLGRLGGRHKA